MSTPDIIAATTIILSIATIFAIEIRRARSRQRETNAKYHQRLSELPLEASREREAAYLDWMVETYGYDGW
jgi:hypothetical protein